MDRIAQDAGVHTAATSSVRQVLALVATADVVLTADTSITHAASAFGKPAVVLFRRGEGEVYGPYRTNGRVVRTAQRMLEEVPVGPVERALNEVLQECALGIAAAGQ
jgi:ADP-heptose:LPS heptosyltransferase